MKNPELCIINNAKATPYFKRERRTTQGEPISAYLFILVFQVFCAIINTNPSIEGLQFFSHNFLYSVYVDDTTFFLGNEKAALKILIHFVRFLFFPVSKSEKKI